MITIVFIYTLFVFLKKKYDIYLWVYQCTVPVIILHSAWKSSPLLFWAPMKEPLKEIVSFAQEKDCVDLTGKWILCFEIFNTLCFNNKRNWASSWKLNLKCREHWFLHKVLKQKTKKLFHFQRSNFLCGVAKAWAVFSHLSAMKKMLTHLTLCTVYCVHWWVHIWSFSLISISK